MQFQCEYGGESEMKMKNYDEKDIDWSLVDSSPDLMFDFMDK